MKTLTGWKTRLLAIKILNLFEKDKKLKEHIERLTKELSPLDRAFVREISSGTVRNLRLLDFIVEKASIAIDGISLTIANVGKNSFVISIIPHTFNNTNLQFSKEGDLVNVEFDYLARFILNKND